jgi:hypothetical protein
MLWLAAASMHHDRAVALCLLSTSACQGLPCCLLQDESGAPVAGPEFSAELAAELDQYGPAVGAPGQWASCIRIVDPAGEQQQHDTPGAACTAVCSNSTAGSAQVHTN